MKICPPSRLHLSLIAMQESGGRINGGIGFAIQKPSLSIQVKASGILSIQDSRKHGLEPQAIARLEEALQSVEKEHGFQQSISVQINGDASAHHSFGTGTAIRLACLEALFMTNNKEYTNDELIQLSGRGGTSGIGIHTYFNGGLVLDLGRKNTGEALQPSSQNSKSIKPLLFQQVTMPSWEIGICFPSDISFLREKEEKAFFKATCPIPESEAYKAMYHAVSGIYAAVCEHDKGAFEAAIKALQECAWKKAERNLHGEALAILEEKLYSHGASTVGMSSLGPCLYFLSDDMDKALVQMKENIPSCTFIKTKPNNSGRVIDA